MDPFEHRRERYLKILNGAKKIGESVYTYPPDSLYTDSMGIYGTAKLWHLPDLLLCQPTSGQESLLTSILGSLKWIGPWYKSTLTGPDRCPIISRRPHQRILDFQLPISLSRMESYLLVASVVLSKITPGYQLLGLIASSEYTLALSSIIALAFSLQMTHRQVTSHT